MKAIVLAAGEGKRLQPLTLSSPKCLVNLFGKSILEWQLQVFRSCNINDISIVTGYLKDMIKFDDVTYFENPKFSTTNMVETLFCAKDKLEDSVIVSYGDIIYQKDVLQKLINSKDDISVIIDKKWKKYWEIRTAQPLNDVESLVLENGFIQNIGQKVSSLDEIEGQYIGLMKFQNEGLEFLKTFYHSAKNESHLGNIMNPDIPFEKSYMTDLLQGLIHAGYKLTSIPINGGWLELDTIDDYDLYNNLKKENNIQKLISLEK